MYETRCDYNENVEHSFGFGCWKHRKPVSAAVSFTQGIASLMLVLDKIEPVALLMIECVNVTKARAGVSV